MEHIIRTTGYLAIFLLMVAEACLIPIPSEVIMLLGGALAAQGKLVIIGVILAGVAGDVLGSYIAWAIGRYGGRKAIDRIGKYVLLDAHDIDRAEHWFSTKGEVTVLVSKALPFVRTFSSLPAGIAGMKPIRFGIYTFIGCAIWETGLAVAGYQLGAKWNSIVHDFSGASYVVAAIVVLVILGAIYHRYKKVRASRNKVSTIK